MDYRSRLSGHQPVPSPSLLNPGFRQRHRCVKWLTLLAAFFIAPLVGGAFFGAALADFAGGVAGVAGVDGEEQKLTRVRVPKAAPNWDAPQKYYVTLLRMALEQGANGRPLPSIEDTLVMEQGRISYELSRGKNVDVYWMGSNIEREQKLRPIRIPLVRGLLGFRRIIIRKDMADDFAKVKNLQDLQRFTACQGLDWPDADILRASRLRVVQLAGYSNLFHALAGHRCDYLPRGYFETDSELKRFTPIHPELMLFKPLIIHYPFPMYFFTGSQNEYLAQWIETGLQRMISNGQLLEFITHHPYTSSAFPLQAAPNWVWIELPNPILSRQTDAGDRRYWFQQSDFQSDLRRD